jgi:hypothetical protein
VIAPRLTKPYREELRSLGVTAQQEEPGIWQLQGGLVVHSTWVLETDELAGLDHPLLTLVSPQFLANRVAIYDLLHQGGYTNLVVYLAQQITQFNLLGKEFAMQHLGTEDEMQQAIRDLVASWPLEQRLAGVSPRDLLEHAPQVLRELVATLPPEERLEGLSPEARMEGLSPELRMEGLSPEERLRGLTAEDRERLRQLLQQQLPKSNSSDGK